MLAYLFWHTRKADARASEYEAGLAHFAQGLCRSGCAGLRSANSFCISAVPWLDNRDGYEDWVVVDGTRVLEELNITAVTGEMTVPHARVAQSMEAGHGGLYYHLWGDLDPHAADLSQWLWRPRGIEFRPVLERITQSAGQPVSVWRRFMVLGPGAEFLVLGNEPLALPLPDGWTGHRVSRRALDPSDT